MVCLVVGTPMQQNTTCSNDNKYKYSNYGNLKQHGSLANMHPQQHMSGSRGYQQGHNSQQGQQQQQG